MEERSSFYYFRDYYIRDFNLCHLDSNLDHSRSIKTAICNYDILCILNLNLKNAYHIF